MKNFLDFCDGLEGELVSLENFSLKDITPDYVGWLNDPEVVKYSNQRFLCHTVRSCRKYVLSFENSFNRFLKIVRKSDMKKIGTMTAYYSVNHGTVDIGMMIGVRSLWGQGYGQDAWNTLLGNILNHENVRKVTAGTMEPNFGMVRIMERSGMILEATRYKQELLDGCPKNLLYFYKFK